MRLLLPFTLLFALLWGCGPKPEAWDGPTLTQPRTQLTVGELTRGKRLPLMDLSFFAKPDWATTTKHSLQGTLSIQEATLDYPKEKEYYPGENIFPALQLDFLLHDGVLIPRISGRISTRDQQSSYWDVIVGAGKAWREPGDGDWSRASFPLTLTDRWIGTARNCVATFVFKPDSLSPICLQCSQETADIDDKGLANISGTLPTSFKAIKFEDSARVIHEYRRTQAARLPMRPLSAFDSGGRVASYFDRMIVTNAPTSLGAVLWNDTLYLHPPATRHGTYPYPDEMRHGVYSVTKSMAGALCLLALEERYPEDTLFDLLIADYVPALAGHPGWQDVTFAQTLNMRTGIDGGEDAARLFHTLVAAETAEEAISNIAALPDLPASPGERFNYASTNLFVLSYALQQFVATKEGNDVSYWELVQEQVLLPIGAESFTILTTMEKDPATAIPILAYGALPTLDEAAKIARLFANEGAFAGTQLLNRTAVQAIFSTAQETAYSTGQDYRGSHYRHGFWAREMSTPGCTVRATYMLGFGENYVVFLPGGSIIFRFLDEHDLDITELIEAVEMVRPSCE